jgi:hypothetical protein
MKKKRALAASREPEYVLLEDKQKPNHIIFQTDATDTQTEMLRITETGFYVRGKLVDQDDKEAQIVYNAFREWMVYSALTRSY